MCMRVTSSTAQGGGGSSKNRKPSYRRGWLLWVTDGRAKRLMDRQVVEVSSLSLSFYLFLWLPTYYLPTYLPTSLPPYLPTSLPPYLPTSLPPYLPTSLPPDLPTSRPPYLPTSLPPCLPTYLPTNHLPTYPPTHPATYLLTTSKTKQFCETSFKNGRLSAELTASNQCVLRFSQSTCLKYCAATKKWCQVICLLYCACHGKCIFADPRQLSHACHRFWKCYKTLTSCSLLTRCAIPCACHAKRHLNLQKWSEPQRRALFRHLNFQKWSQHGVFLTFWLRSLLRATTACTFSTSQLPKVIRTCCALCILTSKCASRHNSVHFLDISISKSGPRMVCFVRFDLEMCFAPQRRAIFNLSSGQLAPHPPL